MDTIVHNKDHNKELPDGNPPQLICSTSVHGPASNRRFLASHRATSYGGPLRIGDAVVRTETHTRHCLAYSAISGDLATHHGPLGGALLYFSMRCGISLVVGDPLASPDQIEPLLDDFLQAHARPSFIQCSEDLARRLEARSFFVNSFGVETELVLSRWSSAGKRAHMLRKNFNKAELMGVKVMEITGDAARLELAQSVSDAWLRATKGTGRELRLLTRPPVFAVEEGTRKFASWHDGQMVGIGFFDPLCVRKTGLGYVYQVLRESPAAPEGTRTHLLLSIANSFRAEGIERLSLGLSPNSLAGIEPLDYSRWTRRLLQISRKWPWYNFAGQEFYKSRFGGDEKTVFVASRSALAAPLLWNIVIETGMLQTYWSQLLG